MKKFYILVTDYDYMVHLKRPEDKFACSRCHSSHVDIYEYKKKKVQACLDCGEEKIISGKD